MSSDRAIRYVIVEIFDDAAELYNAEHSTALSVAREIVGNLEDVKEAYPAYYDGFGHLVRCGDTVTA